METCIEYYLYKHSSCIWEHSHIILSNDAVTQNCPCLLIEKGILYTVLSWIKV